MKATGVSDTWDLFMKKGLEKKKNAKRAGEERFGSVTSSPLKLFPNKPFEISIDSGFETVEMLKCP